MHPCHRQAVAGDADEADETFVACFDGRFDRATFAQRGLPLDHVDEVVELEQVDMIDAEPVERAANLLAAPARSRWPVFVARKNRSRCWREPRREPQLRVAVRGSGVDVVDPVFEQHVERGVGLGLT